MRNSKLTKLERVCNLIYEATHPNENTILNFTELYIEWAVNYDDDEDEEDDCLYHCSSVDVEFGVWDKQSGDAIVLHEKHILYQKEPFTAKSFDLPEFLSGIEKLKEWSEFLDIINSDKERNALTIILDNEFNIPLHNKRLRDSIFNSEIFKESMDERQKNLSIYAEKEKEAIKKKIISHPEFYKVALNYI